MALFGKKKDQIEEPMDLESVMKKYDRESNVRIWEGTPKIVVSSVLALFSLFCIYVTLWTGWLGNPADFLCGLDRFPGISGVPCKEGSSEGESYALV